jgi:hypothetical protein
MKKLFLHSGKMMIGEFPDVQTNALSALSVLNECEAAVSAAKASAVEVVNGEDALHKINDWFLPLPGGGLGRKLNEGQLCDLPTGWTVEYEKQCQYQETDGNCPDCFRGSLCKKIAHLIPASNASGIKYMHDRECRRYRDESVLCQNHCYFKTSGIKECPIKSSGIAAIGVPESGDFDRSEKDEHEVWCNGAWMSVTENVYMQLINNNHYGRINGVLQHGDPESKSPVIPEGSEKHDFCLPWTYQERADKYTHIIRGNSNQHLLQGRQRPDGYEEALFRMIVKAVNAYHSADKPAIDDTLKGRWIRTKDQIPGDFNLVIVCMTSGAITVGRRLRTNNWGIFTSSGIDIESQTNHVEYWQPLPASPAKQFEP